MKTALRYFWHFVVVLFVLAIPVVAIGLWEGAELHFGDDGIAYRANNEGPHIFQIGEEWSLQTLRGNRDQGFWIDEQRHPLTSSFQFDVIFPLDGSRFAVTATPEFVTPPNYYQDQQPILAISDIEGNYKAFRDFLINAKVIDGELNWVFGQGHLVLVGDFVDRGPSVTQVLWLIYKLEQNAKEQGGHVHYILGNHEIKSLQGDYLEAHEKYTSISVLLGKPQLALFADDAFLGRWLMSKNTVEVINGVLFVHGGLHPALAERSYTLDDLNRIVRAQYRKIWYPKANPGEDDLLLNPKTGPSWYRGYFKDDLSLAQVEQTLKKFDAKAAVVGHTLHSEVEALFDKKVFAIDVRHPWDYRSGFPLRSSEGLRIDSNKVWRILEDGRQHEL